MEDIDNPESIRPLKKICRNIDIIFRNPFERDRMKAITGYFSILPRDVLATYSHEMADLVSKITRDRIYDVVIASVSNAAAYAVSIPVIPRILEEHNFMAGWMEENYRVQTSVIGKFHKWLTWKKRLRYDRWLIPRFNRCTMVSERDCQAVKQVIPGYGDRVTVIPNGVNLESHYPGISDPIPKSLIFNGALTYDANFDAMRFFLRDIFPAIRTHLPDVELTITGPTEGVDLEALQGKENVIFSGFLPDIRPAVSGAWVCVVPLRKGAGTRLKILEAMALGTPVISTSKGAEGLNVSPGENILITDDPKDFAKQIIRLLGDPELRARLSKSGRALVEAEYGWDSIGKEFVRLVENVVNECNSNH